MFPSWSPHQQVDEEHNEREQEHNALYFFISGHLLSPSLCPVTDRAAACGQGVREFLTDLSEAFFSLGAHERDLGRKFFLPCVHDLCERREPDPVGVCQWHIAHEPLPTGHQVLKHLMRDVVDPLGIGQGVLVATLVFELV